MTQLKMPPGNPGRFTETARRVRQRIGLVLDWSYSNGFRDSVH